MEFGRFKFSFIWNDDSYLNEIHRGLPYYNILCLRHM